MKFRSFYFRIYSTVLVGIFIYSLCPNNTILAQEKLKFVDYGVLDLSRANTEPEQYLKELQDGLANAAQRKDTISHKKLIKKIIALVDFYQGESLLQYNYLSAYSGNLFKEGNVEKAMRIIDRGIRFFTYYNHFNGLGSYQVAKSGYLWEMGEFAASLETLEIGVENFEKELNEMTYTSALFRHRLATRYTFFGEFEKSNRTLKQILRWAEKNEENYPNMSGLLSSVANSYYGMAKFNEALEIYKKIIELNEDSLDYSKAYGLTFSINLMSCYLQLNRTLLARKTFYEMYEKGLSTIDLIKIIGLIPSPNDFFSIVELKGFVEQLVPLDLNGIKLDEKLKVLESFKRLLISIKDFKTALDISNDLLNSYPKEVNTPVFLDALIMHFYLKLSSKELTGLDEIKKKIKNLIEKLRLQDDYLNARFLHEQVRADIITGEVENSLKKINEAIRIAENIGLENKILSNYYQTKGSILRRIGRPKEAAEFYLKNFNQFEKELIGTVNNSTRRESQFLLSNRKSDIAMYQSLAFSILENEPNFASEVMSIKANLKGLSLRRNIALRETIFNSNQSLIEAKKKLELLKTFPKKYVTEIEALENQIDGLEVESLLNGQLNGDSSEINFLTSKQILAALNENESYVDFSIFKYYNGDFYENESKVFAYVYNSQTPRPIAIELTTLSNLEELLGKNDQNQITYNFRGSEAVGNNFLTEISKELYALLWKPLEKHLKEGSNINYAPDGILHYIPFAMLKDEKGILLKDKYDLIQLFSCHHLLSNRNEPLKKNALLLGDVSYDGVISTRKEAGNQKDLKVAPWKNLSGTRIELDSLKRLLNHNGISTEVLQGSYASEENFKKLNKKSPDILHVATHGYFFSKNMNEENTYAMSNTISNYQSSEDSFIRSGLILSGGNYGWENGIPQIGKEEDGILTALEISNMDLSNTHLAILSACETGLGDIDGSEGVYGLQRAFKIAGVNKIIMTLWKISDRETPTFMIEFYKNWLKGKTAKKAFKTAQDYMNKKYPENPEYWGGFVLIE